MNPLERLVSRPGTAVMFDHEPDARALLNGIEPTLEDRAKQESLLRAKPAVFILYPKVPTHWLWIAWHDPSVYQGADGGLSVVALPKSSHTLDAAHSWLAEHLAKHGEVRFSPGRIG